MYQKLKVRDESFYTFSWVLLQTAFLFLYMMIFLGMEKWVDLGSNSSISASANLSLVENGLVFILFCLGGKSHYFKLQTGVLLVVVFLLVAIFQVESLSYYASFILMALIAWLCYHLIPIMSVVLSNFLEAAKRGRAVQLQSTSKAFSQIVLVGASYFLLTSYFSVRVYFGIALVLLLLVSYLLYVLKPFFPDRSTLSVNGTVSNLKSFTTMSGVMLLFGVTYFGFRTYSLINRQYLGDVFGKPEYENVLLLTVCYLIGGLLVSLGAVKISRKLSIRASFVVASGILILFVATIYLRLPLFMLYMIVILMGIGNYGVSNVMKIYVNESYEGDELYRNAKLLYVIPFLSSALCLFVYGKLTSYGLNVMLLALIGVVAGAGLLLLISGKRKEKNFTGL